MKRGDSATQRRLDLKHIRVAGRTLAATGEKTLGDSGDSEFSEQVVTRDTSQERLRNDPRERRSRYGEKVCRNPSRLGRQAVEADEQHKTAEVEK